MSIHTFVSTSDNYERQIKQTNNFLNLSVNFLTICVSNITFLTKKGKLGNFFHVNNIYVKECGVSGQNKAFV